MPREPNRSFRLPSVAAKISQIKGLSAEEKALFVRIGNLLDTFVVTQRAENNPSQVKGRKFSTRVPVPQNLTARGVIGGVELQWDAVDFNEFYAYELQYAGTATFASPVIQQVSTTQITIRDEFVDDLFVRVRTIGKRGQVSAFSATVSLTVATSIYSVDSDYTEPENRTNVLPRPGLLSADLSVTAGDQAFVGVGGAVGPGPINDSDVSASGDLNIRNQITYSLIDSDTIVEQRAMLMPDGFVEQEKFYLYDPSFYLRFSVFPGSFVDFFSTIPLTLDPSNVNIEFLRYLRFYMHHQSGIVLNGVNSIIKH